MSTEYEGCYLECFTNIFNILKLFVNSDAILDYAIKNNACECTCIDAVIKFLSSLILCAYASPCHTYNSEGLLSDVTTAMTTLLHNTLQMLVDVKIPEPKTHREAVFFFGTLQSLKTPIRYYLPKLLREHSTIEQMYYVVVEKQDERYCIESPAEEDGNEEILKGFIYSFVELACLTKYPVAYRCVDCSHIFHYSTLAIPLLTGSVVYRTASLRWECSICPNVLAEVKAILPSLCPIWGLIVAKLSCILCEFCSKEHGFGGHIPSSCVLCPCMHVRATLRTRDTFYYMYILSIFGREYSCSTPYYEVKDLLGEIVMCRECFQRAILPVDFWVNLVAKIEEYGVDHALQYLREVLSEYLCEEHMQYMDKICEAIRKVWLNGDTSSLISSLKYIR